MHEYLLAVVREGENLEELMAPWGKGIRVPGHWGEPVSDNEKKCFIRQYVGECEERDFEEAYKEYIEAASLDELRHVNLWRKDPEGIWRWWIEWEANPLGEWDWWRIGGGWCSGALNLKDESSTEPYADPDDDVWGEKWIEHLRTHPRASDRGLKGDVTNLEELEFTSVLMDGEWILVEGRIYDYIKDLPDNAELVCIDYHC